MPTASQRSPSDHAATRPPARRGPFALAAVATLTSLLASPAVAGADPALDRWPPLPAPVANNAVAALRLDGADTLFSFLGLGPGRSHRDIVASAYELDLAAGRWTALPPVPGPPRLASVAVGIGSSVYLFGGYTVAEDGSEKSRPELYAWRATERRWERLSDLPLPVDDAVALAWRDRWIVLVSGWHDDGNVDAVQIYDTREDRWTSSTPYPGTPVFGHAGGIVGDRFVVADGVRVAGRTPAGRRVFRASDEAWLGELSAAAPGRITWTRLPPHPGPPRYRMAAGGDAAASRVLFAGGAENPYNYDGIGYDGVPSEPSAAVVAWDLAAHAWRTLPPKPVATMDHRGLVPCGAGFCTVGGMEAGQRVTDRVLALE